MSYGSELVRHYAEVKARLWPTTPRVRPPRPPPHGVPIGEPVRGATITPCSLSRIAPEPHGRISDIVAVNGIL